MTNLKKIFAICSFILLSSILYSQESNSFILKTQRFIPIRSIERILDLNSENNLHIIFKERNLYSFESKINIDKKIERMLNISFVEFIEKEEPLEYRNTPNDKYFYRQYALEQINAPKVWDFTTGGLSGIGDTIVIAILDKGCDINHEDLKENIWINRDEIPNDGIDNDQNGYTDDYKGVDLVNKNDNHEIDDHGTLIAGIIGAKGNNKIGISGVNQNVKLLVVTNINRPSQIIEGYQYILNLRKKYNESNGKKGAFIVSSNLSAGNNSFPYSSKINSEWCEIYNLLGDVGILNVCASKNDHVDIEMAGDMPSLCQSDFIIPVTSTDNKDNYVQSRSYSKKSIDIAAPGQSIFSTTLDNKYTNKNVNGNSFAAPHVAGAIGLIYTIPCKKFTDKIKNNPAQLNIEIKNYLLDYSEKHSDLKATTVSGGRLDIYNTYKHMVKDYCEYSIEESLSINNLYPNPNQGYFTINYSSNNIEKHILHIFNSLGQRIYTKVFTPEFNNKGLISVSIPSIINGIYFAQIISKTDIETKTFRIQNK